MIIALLVSRVEHGLEDEQFQSQSDPKFMFTDDLSLSLFLSFFPLPFRYSSIIHLPILLFPSKLPDYSSDLDPLSSPPLRKNPKLHLSTPLSSTLNAKRKRDAAAAAATSSPPTVTNPTPPQKKQKRSTDKSAGGGAVSVGETRTTRYECVGVVKVKVVFSKRFVCLRGGLKGRGRGEETKFGCLEPDLFSFIPPCSRCG